MTPAVLRGLFQSGFERAVIQEVFRFIEWFLRLPSDLQERLQAELEDMSREQKAIYLTKWERLGADQGLQLTRRAAVLRLLEVRFGVVHRAFAPEVEAITDQDHLARLIDAAALAGDLATFSKALQRKARAGPRGGSHTGRARRSRKGPARPGRRPPSTAHGV